MTRIDVLIEDTDDDEDPELLGPREEPDDEDEVEAHGAWGGARAPEA